MGKVAPTFLKGQSYAFYDFVPNLYFAGKFTILGGDKAKKRCHLSPLSLSPADSLIKRMRGPAWETALTTETGENAKFQTLD